MEWEGFGRVSLFHVPKEMSELAKQFPSRFSYTVTCISKPIENQFHNTPNCKILCYTAQNKHHKPRDVCLPLSYQIITTVHIKK